jgi:uncharacterized protein
MALPSQIDPRKLAVQGALLEGHIPVGDLTRLSLSVEAITGPLNVSIKFGLDESKQQIATGSAAVSVKVICQRCLDLMTINLVSDFALQIICSEDQITSVAPNYEPWVVNDRIADLVSVIEDELLLALPIVNYHPIGECSGDAFQNTAVDSTEEPDNYSPFSILKQLKK